MKTFDISQLFQHSSSSNHTPITKSKLDDENNSRQILHSYFNLGHIYNSLEYCKLEFDMQNVNGKNLCTSPEA